MKFPLLTVPISWQGTMHFHYRDSKITIAIIAISILLLSTSWCPCVVSSSSSSSSSTCTVYITLHYYSILQLALYICCLCMCIICLLSLPLLTCVLCVCGQVHMAVEVDKKIASLLLVQLPHMAVYSPWRQWDIPQGMPNTVCCEHDRNVQCDKKCGGVTSKYCSMLFLLLAISQNCLFDAQNPSAASVYLGRVQGTLLSK